MANEINAMVSDKGEVPSGIMATGSCVAGDWLKAYQTATDDMYAAARQDAFVAGSLAVQRAATTGVDSDLIVGIANNDAGSGDTVGILTDGIFIGLSAGAVTAGHAVMQEGNSGVIDYNDDASGAHRIVGTALTGASAASKYVAFKLNL